MRRVRVQKEPADCEYLVDGRLCKAVIEQSEGRDVRKNFARIVEKTIVAIYVPTVKNARAGLLNNWCKVVISLIP